MHDLGRSGRLAGPDRRAARHRARHADRRRRRRSSTSRASCCSRTPPRCCRPKSVVIELREDIVVDAEVDRGLPRPARSRATRWRSTTSSPTPAPRRCCRTPSFVKLDVLDTPPIIWQPLAHRLASPSVHVVAERVETVDVVAQARDAGCTLFQGYYFCRPATQSAKALPARRLAYLNLFSAVNKPDLTIDELEDLVKRDVSLTMRVLRSINSAAFALGQRDHLGAPRARAARRAAGAAVGVGLGDGRPQQRRHARGRCRSRCCARGRARSSATRGRAPRPAPSSSCSACARCSTRSSISRWRKRSPDSSSLRACATRSSAAPARCVAILDAVIAHEQGDWDRSAQIIEGLGLSASLLPTAYTDALRWTRDISANAAAA